MESDDRYEMLEQIGSGRYATVYRARDKSLGREVAIKQIHEQFLGGSLRLDRYWHEAQLLASLQHPNIVTIYDIDRERGWLVMELMQSTLAERISGRQIDLRSLRTALAHCLRALKYLHERGIVHGDLKPSNMMLDNRRRIKVGDFGLARRVSDRDGTLLKGSTRYIAPEIVSDDFGAVDTASDLYSLGFSAYELMCGPQFESLCLGLGAMRTDQAGEDPWIEWHAGADRRLPEINRILEGVPDDLARVIQKLTEKDQRKRYATADEALSDLGIDVKLTRRDDAATEMTDGDEDAGDDQPGDGADRRRRTALIAVAASMALSILLLIFGPSRNTGGPGPGPPPPPSGEPVYVLTEVSVDGRQLKVREMDKNEVTPLELPEGARIFISLGREGREFSTTKALKEGQRIVVTRDQDTRIKELVVLPPKTHSGTVRQVDLVYARLVITPDSGTRRDDVTVRIAAGSRLVFNHDADSATLVDLFPGDQARVSHVEDAGGTGQRLAVSLTVSREIKTGALVDHVDVEGRLLTLRQGISNQSHILRPVLPVALRCEISGHGSRWRPGREFGLDDIQPNDWVNVTHGAAVTQIDVTRPGKTVKSTLDSVDPKNRVILLTAAGSRPQEFHVGDDCPLVLEDAPCQLSELRPDDTVTVFFEPVDGRRPEAMAVIAERARHTDRFVMLLANQRYRDHSLPELPYIAWDLRLLARTLVRHYRVRPDSAYLLSVLDQPRQAMQKSIEQFLGGIKGGKQLIVYVGGHAFTGDDQGVYVAGRDYDRARANETSMSLAWLIEQLETCKVEQKLLLLDSSHDIRGSDRDAQPSTEEMLAPIAASQLRTVHAIASCSKGQRGLDSNNERHGLFPLLVARGFRGPADLDDDGLVNSEELQRFLEDRMRKAGEQLGGTQTPRLFVPR